MRAKYKPGFMVLQRQGSRQLLSREARDMEGGQPCEQSQPSGVPRLPGLQTSSHAEDLRVEQQSGEGRRMKRWGKVSGSLKFFSAFPASPACFTFKQLQSPSPPAQSGKR